MVIRWWWNRSFLNKVKNNLDFIGLNFYFHHLLKMVFRDQATMKEYLIWVGNYILGVLNQ